MSSVKALAVASWPGQVTRVTAYDIWGAKVKCLSEGKCDKIVKMFWFVLRLIAG